MSQTTSTRTLTDEQLAAFHRDGFLVIPQLFAPHEIRQIRDAFTDLGRNGPVAGLSDDSRLNPGEPLARWPRMMHPHRHGELPVGPLSMRYLLDARAEAILCDLFGEEPIAAQTMFYFKPPGARGQDLHQDNFYLRVRPGTCMAAWTAIDDADRENGGLVVVPGSHRLDLFCPEPADNAMFFTTEHVSVPAGLSEVPVDIRAGDVLFFNGSLIHGSYPNTSRDRFRRAFICHYVPANCVEVSTWYRPLLRFDGSEIAREAATGGGPCGTVAEAKGPH